MDVTGSAPQAQQSQEPEDPAGTLEALLVSVVSEVGRNTLTPARLGELMHSTPRRCENGDTWNVEWSACKCRGTIKAANESDPAAWVRVYTDTLELRLGALRPLFGPYDVDTKSKTSFVRFRSAPQLPKESFFGVQVMGPPGDEGPILMVSVMRTP
jgi:hypothetical protein